MIITQREPDDLSRLEELARHEPLAKPRDRYRAVKLALEGQEAPSIAQRLGRSRRFVQRWAYAYRDGGILALAEKPRSGRPARLRPEHQEPFKARLDAGATPADGVCSLRGKDTQRILESEFGVRYSLRGVYALLDRLGYSLLRPRPRHPQNDPPAMEQFKKDAPLLSKKSRGSIPTRAWRSGPRTRPASASRAR